MRTAWLSWWKEGVGDSQCRHSCAAGGGGGTSPTIRLVGVPPSHNPDLSQHNSSAFMSQQSVNVNTVYDGNSFWCLISFPGQSSICVHVQESHKLNEDNCNVISTTGISHQSGVTIQHARQGWSLEKQLHYVSCYPCWDRVTRKILILFMETKLLWSAGRVEVKVFLMC